MKKAIEEERVAGITIDTSIYEQYQFGFEVGHLSRVTQFARSDVSHIIVDIVWHEVSTHLIKQAKADQAHVKNSLKPLGNSWGITSEERDKTLLTLFGNTNDSETTTRRQKNYADATGAAFLKSSEYADLSKVVQFYFESTPPFSDKENKKNEFPDALTLLTLEKWAEQKEKLVLAVAKDGDWKSFCEKSNHICYIEDLPQALSVFHGNENIALNLVMDFLKKEDIEEFDKAVIEEINTQSHNLDISGEGDSQFSVELELTDVTISAESPVHEQALGTLEVIEYVDNVLHTKIAVSCNVSAEFSASFEKWDGIDKEYLGMGNATVSGDEITELEFLLTFNIGDGGVKYIGAELVFERINMEFSDLEPDWMNDPDNYDH